MSTEIKDLVSMYFERESAMQTLWQIYIGIAIGLLAFAGAVPNALKKNFLPIFLSVCFIGFAYVNGSAIHDVVKARHMLSDAITAEQPTDNENRALVNIVRKTEVPSEGSTKFFCIGADIAVLAGIWGLVWSARSKSRKLG